MPLHYEPPAAGPLCLGEVLATVVEPRVVEREGSIQAVNIHHPLAVVLNSACDLEWDYKLRTDEVERSLQDIDAEPSSVPYLLLVEAQNEEKIRSPEGINSRIFRRMKKLQDDRRHFLPRGRVGETGRELDELFMDFKKLFTLPSGLVYQRIEAGAIERVAVVPPVFVHQLAQRFFSYHSRVGVPDL